MDLDNFLSLVATVFGALGAVYVMLGILGMSPDLMEAQTQTRWNFSAPQLEALAHQKADNVAGFVFVITAFTVGAVTLAFVPEGVRAFSSKGVAIALVVVLAAVLYITLHFISEAIYKHQKRAMVTIVVGRFVDGVLDEGRLGVAREPSLAGYARLLELEVPSEQSPQLLFERVAKEIGREVPGDLDYGPSK